MDNKICFISTYGLRNDWSYKGEEFISVGLTWKLGVSNIDALKIRIAKWKPKYDRSNQAIFYFGLGQPSRVGSVEGACPSY